MNVAVAHDLPTGGALRVLAEWLARTQAGEVTLYCRKRETQRFVSLPARVRVEERPLREGDRVLDEAIRLARSPREGRRLAREIDEGGHDAVFCFASRLTQAIDVLPFLATPSLYYAPEPLRSAYEPCESSDPPRGARERVGAMVLAGLGRRRRQLDRRYIRSAPRIVTHSRFTRQTLSDIYEVDAEVVALGVDAQTFTPSKCQRERYVLSVGALHPLKGHDQVILALALLAEPRPSLMIVGDRGESEPALESLARQHGVSLDLRSRLSLNEVVEAYRRAALVVCAQIREPFGLVPLEAMACATPVVAVDEGGFRETILDGQTGLLCDRDPRAMADAIARVLSDDELATRLGADGRERASHDWTWDQTAASFDDILRRGAEQTGSR